MYTVLARRTLSASKCVYVLAPNCRVIYGFGTPTDTVIHAATLAGVCDDIYECIGRRCVYRVLDIQNTKTKQKKTTQKTKITEWPGWR